MKAGLPSPVTTAMTSQLQAGHRPAVDEAPALNCTDGRHERAADRRCDRRDRRPLRYSPAWLKTIRTAGSRTSDEYFGDVLRFSMAAVSQESEPPTHLGRFSPWTAPGLV